MVTRLRRLQDRPPWRRFPLLSQPAHLLAGDEHLFALRAGGRGAVEHRGCLHGAGTDAVAADALGDEVERDRAREQRNRRLGRTVDITVGRWPQRRARRDVDDAAASARQHRRQKRLDGPVHGFHVEVE